MGSAFTRSGIPDVGDIPWGGHFCHFFSDRVELVRVLVPFFDAGLRNRERCVWITAAPLSSAEAAEELRKSYPPLDEAIRDGRVTIRDFSTWYLDSRGASAGDVLSVWLQEEERALAEGYEGLRVAGNTSFLKSGDWDAFMQYEEAVSRAFSTRRVVALCSYDVRACEAADIFDVIHRHHFTLDRTSGGWEVLERTPRRFEP